MPKVAGFVLVFTIVLNGASANAQQVTGSIVGRVIDATGAAVTGAPIAARNADTGFAREAASDENGVYRLVALPVGRYILSAQRDGSARFERTDIVVNVSRTTEFDIVLLTAIEDTVSVTARAPMISTASSSVGQVVDVSRIESLPLNGRQFASLAATVPGVGLGFHSDVTKTSQMTPQINGGNGRNVNFVVDGGDNNDDTVGGLLQLYPLEAIQEFDVITQRFTSEYGRNGAAVINVVTKSGTNQVRGSWFTLFRDDALNGRTESERRANLDKQVYRRYQFGGSVGGPIALDRIHYFAAYERTNQRTRQVVDTLGVFPNDDGVFPVEFGENLFTGKLTVVPNASHYLSLRYGRDTNQQPTGAGLRAARSSWATSYNTYDSVNLNHNWIMGGSSLNEFIFQYGSFVNNTPATNDLPILRFPGTVTGGAPAAAPQRTDQTKWQIRNDYSWTVDGWGLGQQWKIGVSWIHEPELRATFAQGTNGLYTFGALDLNGPITDVLVIGEDNTSLNFPLDSYALFLQNDWMVSSRLTLNLGVRWDYIAGMPINQDINPNFLALQAAGRTGRFAGTVLEDFGKDPQGDKDNIQPRLGFAFDLSGTGQTIVRGGWGIYTDFGYTNANALTAAIDAGGGGGPVFIASAPTGLRKQDGTLFRLADPLSTIAHLNQVLPGVRTLAGEVVSPRLEQPFTYQTSIGVARELGTDTALTVDYVRVDARDLNVRLRLNALVNGVPYLSGVGITPSTNLFRTALSVGRGRYDGLILALRRRMANGFDVNASYTLSRSTSDIGTAADEIVTNLLQDVTNPLADEQMGPSTRTDARHRVTLSAIVEAPFGIRVAPIFMYRSALPTHTFEGLDLNADGQVLTDRTLRAYAYTGLNDTGVATFEETGACETVNCSRRAPYSQLNLRVSRSFSLPGAARIEAIAEVFNVFNALNPSLPLTSRRLSANGAPLTTAFMQPTAFAGDTGQPEQRIGQIGFRITF